MLSMTYIAYRTRPTPPTSPTCSEKQKKKKKNKKESNPLRYEDIVFLVNPHTSFMQSMLLIVSLISCLLVPLMRSSMSS